MGTRRKKRRRRRRLAVVDCPLTVIRKLRSYAGNKKVRARVPSPSGLEQLNATWSRVFNKSKKYGI